MAIRWRVAALRSTTAPLIVHPRKTKTDRRSTFSHYGRTSERPNGPLLARKARFTFGDHLITLLIGGPGMKQAERSSEDQKERAAKSVARRLSPLVSRLLIIFMCLALLGAIISVPPSYGWLARWAVRGTLLAGLAWALWFYTTRQYTRPMAASHRKTEPWQLPGDQVFLLQRSSGARGAAHLEHVDHVQVRSFAYAIVDPAMVRQRITERYEPGRRTLTQRVTIEAQLPSRTLTTHEPGEEPSGPDMPGVILFPVLVPPKGDLINDLRVTGADGSLLPILSYRQYLQLVARTLRSLMCVAYGVQHLKRQDYPEAFEAEQLALTCVMRRGRDGNDVSGFSALLQLTDGVKNRHALKLAADLTDRLASRYAIVAACPVPVDGRFVVAYERVVTPRLEHREAGKAAALKRWVRDLLGARPIEIGINIDDAASCQSYHLVVDAQDGVYVGEQVADNLTEYLQDHVESQERRRRAGKVVGDPPPYFRFLRRAGQRHAHFYTRFFPKPDASLSKGAKVPSLQFRFYEVPPGSIFRAMVGAIASTALIWLVGFMTSHAGDGSNPGTDAPAFLLVFPAIAAGLLGFEARPHHLLEGTLAARLSLICTALCSLVGSGLYMAYQIHLISTDSAEAPFSIVVWGIDSWPWILLLLLCVLNAGCSVYVYLQRSWNYWHLSYWRGDDFRDPVEL
ncbi:MAG: hypothetical protein HOV76_09975 [Hamadaea sp.]|nr:hypothetical protein [Hamadaea sp.]